MRRLVLGLMIFGGFVPVHAAQTDTALLEEKRNELKQMETRKKEIQLHLKESYLAEQEALKRIEELSQKIETLQKQIIQTNQQQKHTRLILSRQTHQVEQLKNQVQQHEQSIQKHVRSIYRFLKGKQALSLANFQDKLSYKNKLLMEQVLHHEILRLQDFYQKRQTLEKLLAPYQHRQGVQEQLFQEASGTKTVLEQKQQEHQRRLTNIQQDQQIYFRYLDELQQSMEKVTAELDHWEHQNLLASQFQESQGLFPLKRKLPPAVEGKLIQPFRKNKKTGQPTFQGITIATPEGSSMSAIALGKVVFAGALQGYRKLAIVDHGKNSFSVYGKLKVLHVAVGDFVEQGTRIGDTFSEPLFDRTEVYFEIRHQGASVNPLRWLKSGVYRR